MTASSWIDEPEAPKVTFGGPVSEGGYAARVGQRVSGSVGYAARVGQRVSEGGYAARVGQWSVAGPVGQRAGRVIDMTSRAVSSCSSVSLPCSTKPCSRTT